MVAMLKTYYMQQRRTGTGDDTAEDGVQHRRSGTTDGNVVYDTAVDGVPHHGTGTDTAENNVPHHWNCTNNGTTDDSKLERETAPQVCHY